MDSDKEVYLVRKNFFDVVFPELSTTTGSGEVFFFFFFFWGGEFGVRSAA
jgi:hypothetical protein